MLLLIIQNDVPFIFKVFFYFRCVRNATSVIVEIAQGFVGWARAPIGHSVLVRPDRVDEAVNKEQAHRPNFVRTWLRRHHFNNSFRDTQ